MAGSDLHDSAQALQYKEKGNKCFQAGDYTGAEALYTKAIHYDPSNPLLYTNRAMALLKLSLWPSVIADSQTALLLFPENMKAYYYLAQAETALFHPQEALHAAKQAHKFCVEDMEKATKEGHPGGGKSAGSLSAITELVLRCKKEDWERREKQRVRDRNALLDELLDELKRKQERDLMELSQNGAGEVEVNEMHTEYDGKIESLKKTFEAAGEAGGEDKRRKVPDWILDAITFSVMLDPVMTKTGQSYDRSSIMEHLKRSATDPLTREPLSVHDLRPNLALREACALFLEDNGWAVDW